jgi:hypothetical protein
MRRHRPTSVLVVAILHLVGGGLSLLFGLCGLGRQVVSQGNPVMFQRGPQGPEQKKRLQEFQKALQAHLDRELPYNRTVKYINTGNSYLLDVMLISAGIGLLYLQPWARTLSLVYAVLSLLAKVITIGTVSVTWPVLSAFVERQARGDPNLTRISLAMQITEVIMIGLLVIVAIYPIAVLIVLTRPSVKAAFKRKRAPAIDSEAEERWEEGRFRDDREPPPETYTREP